jgi:hypothetical protein
MTSPTDKTLTPTDRDALERAFAAARRDPVQRRRIDEWLAAGEAWESVAKSCAVLCQDANLRLMPWQLPPASRTIADHLDDALREPGGPSGRREAAELLKKLLELGLSRYEPDPAGAIAAAEQRQPN